MLLGEGYMARGRRVESAVSHFQEPAGVHLCHPLYVLKCVGVGVGVGVWVPMCCDYCVSMLSVTLSLCCISSPCTQPHHSKD